MPLDLTVHSLGSATDIKQLVDFVHKQDLGYPNYHGWVQRTEQELLAEWKKAVLASTRGNLIGDIIYQPHKRLPRVMELKNLRIDPHMRGRELARFMLKQVEHEAIREGYEMIMADVRSSQHSMLTFMQKCGFKAIATLPLYESSATDVVVIKPLNLGIERSYAA